jgi:hypothetical protein
MLRFKEFIKEDLDEANLQKVNRIRGGKVQRRKLISARAGYRVQAGKLIRMTSMERRNRHLAQIKAARKRKPMIARILRKRAVSLTRRKSAGIK